MTMTKKERPETGISKRSLSGDLRPANDCKTDYSRFAPERKPQFWTGEEVSSP